MCRCIDEVDPGAVHGTVGVKWRFEADPPDRLDVTLYRDTLDYTPAAPQGTRISVAALYGDGTPAPLRRGSELVYSTATGWGNILLRYCNYGVCHTRGYGQSVEGYHGIWSADFVADGGGGSAPPEEGPLCDTAVDVTVQMVWGGASGSDQVVIRGTDPPSSDTLVVSVSPSNLAPGDTAVVTARHFTEGCLGEELPDDTWMTVSVPPEEAIFSRLHYGEQSGDIIYVFYDALKAGEVLLIADGATPLRPTDITITVAGGGAEGEGHATIEGKARLDVIPQPDTIYAPPGVPNGSAIVVIARDGSGEEMSLPTEARVTLSIPAGYIDSGVRFAAPHTGHSAEVSYAEARNGVVELESIVRSLTAISSYPSGRHQTKRALRQGTASWSW